MFFCLLIWKSFFSFNIRMCRKVFLMEEAPLRSLEVSPSLLLVNSCFRALLVKGTSALDVADPHLRAWWPLDQTPTNHICMPTHYTLTPASGADLPLFPSQSACLMILLSAGFCLFLCETRSHRREWELCVGDEFREESHMLAYIKSVVIFRTFSTSYMIILPLVFRMRLLHFFSRLCYTKWRAHWTTMTVHDCQNVITSQPAAGLPSAASPVNTELFLKVPISHPQKHGKKCYVHWDNQAYWSAILSYLQRECLYSLLVAIYLLLYM